MQPYGVLMCYGSRVVEIGLERIRGRRDSVDGREARKSCMEKVVQ